MVSRTEEAGREHLCTQLSRRLSEYEKGHTWSRLLSVADAAGATEGSLKKEIASMACA
jgi:hypothetical protein